jgi:hypothetical protein
VVHFGKTKLVPSSSKSAVGPQSAEEIYAGP